MKFVLLLLVTVTVFFSLADTAVASVSSYGSMALTCNRHVISHPATANYNSPETLRVSYVKGRAIVIRPGEVCAPLTKGMEISVRDIIHTGVDGFVSLAIEQNLSLNIHPETAGELLRCDSNQLYCVRPMGNVLRDGLDNNSSARKTNAEYFIMVPYWSAAVRG